MRTSTNPTARSFAAAIPVEPVPGPVSGSVVEIVVVGPGGTIACGADVLGDGAVVVVVVVVVVSQSSGRVKVP